MPRTRDRYGPTRKGASLIIEPAKSGQSRCCGCDKLIAVGDFRIGKSVMGERLYIHNYMYYHVQCLERGVRGPVSLDQISGSSSLTAEERAMVHGHLVAMFGEDAVTEPTETLRRSSRRSAAQATQALRVQKVPNAISTKAREVIAGLDTAEELPALTEQLAKGLLARDLSALSRENGEPASGTKAQQAAVLARLLKRGRLALPPTPP